jgi:signal recognition particle subunit SRP72
LSGSEPEEQTEIGEIRVNAKAIDAMMYWSGKGGLVSSRDGGSQDLGSYDTAYNTACACIARGELSQAAVLLRLSIGE